MVAVNPLISVDKTRGNVLIPLVNFYFMKGLAIITPHGWLAVQVLFPNAPFFRLPHLPQISMLKNRLR